MISPLAEQCFHLCAQLTNSRPRQPSSPNQAKYIRIAVTFTDMTRLTITEDAGDEFTIRGRNTVMDTNDDEIVFYNEVTKVHVVPERQSFTIQVLTPAFAIEMDFADADSVREALSLFEAKKVLEVDFDAPDSVRITPSSASPESTEA
jgi:hypothetical protein